MVPRTKILVHACCASCSSHVLSFLSERFEVAAFYYNPNIQPEEEYLLRLDDIRKVCSALEIRLYEGEYAPEDWEKRIEPFRHLPEKSERCWQCYAMRLEATASKAAELGIGLFTSTLSVSPHKLHTVIVREGEKAAAENGIEFLGEDFKKKDGFRISVEKSRELGLTRQDYCGCLLSLEESENRKKDSG